MLPLKNRLFLDTETDGVRPLRRIWDIGWVMYDADGQRTQRSILIDDINLSEAEPTSLSIGQFKRRHPLAGGKPESTAEPMTEAEAAPIVFQALYDAVVAGIVVNFDTLALDNMLRRNNLCLASWHHLVCVENQALGALQNEARHTPAVAETHAELIRQARQDRWKTDDIAAAFGVSLPAHLRHTAVGDAVLAEMILLASTVDGVIPLPGVQWTPPDPIKNYLAAAEAEAAQRPEYIAA